MATGRKKYSPSLIRTSQCIYLSFSLFLFFSSSNQDSIEYLCACVLANMCQTSLGRDLEVAGSHETQLCKCINYCHITPLIYCPNLHSQEFLFIHTLDNTWCYQMLTVHHSDEQYLMSLCELIFISNARKDAHIFICLWGLGVFWELFIHILCPFF